MRTHLNRWIAALLVLALALGLTGCKEDEQKTVDLVFQPAPNYTQETLALPVESGQLEGCCTDGGSIWFLVTSAEDAPPALCRVPLNGGTAELLPEYQPPEQNENAFSGYLGPVWGGDGKLWIWEQNVVRNGEDRSTTYQMKQLDPAAGSELDTVDVTAAMERLDLSHFSGMAVDKNGNVFLSDSEHVTVTNKQGELLFTLEEQLRYSGTSGSAGGPLALLPDGSTAVLTQSAVKTVDLNAQDWGETAYPVGASQIFSGTGDCLFYYIQNNALYGMVEGDELPQRLLPWSNTHLEEGCTILCFTLMDDGRVAVLTQGLVKDWEPYAGQLSATLLSPTDELPEDGKMKLVYGMIGDDYAIRYRLEQFNRNNDVYYIEARDYAEGMLHMSETAYDSAVTRLFAEMAAGNGPDILDNSMPLEKLGKQGGLEDLWPWIENDPDLGRDGVMSHVLECLETDGKLYQICGSFTINTAVASRAVAGDRTGWTMEEMLNAFGGEMPDFYFGSTSDYSITANFARFDRKSMLENLVRMNLGQYVDWETGECTFDGEDFKAVLRLCGESREAENGIENTAENIQARYEAGFLDSAANFHFLEPVQVRPWEGEPVLCTRTLITPMDLVVDDVLFGGRECLWDYEQKLWDADILYNWVSEYNGREITSCSIDMQAFNYIETSRFLGKYAKGGRPELAADAASGAMDGEVYAAYVGLPTQNGTGSSFSVYNKAGISASSPAKEGAWAFLRYLLLPDGNTAYFSYEGSTSTGSYGFPMNRAEFERQVMLETQWCINEETGEFYLDSNGERVEKAVDCMAIGDPAAMLVYQLAPSQAQKDRFWNLYNSIEHVSGSDEDLMNIIIEQAQPYFAGDKSLDETASLIQNRAKLYVNERR